MIEGKSTVKLSEFIKTTDNQTIKYYKEDENGKIIGRKFVHNGVTMINMFHTFIWQMLGGDDKQGNVIIPFTELISGRNNPDEYYINLFEKRGFFPSSQMICDNRNWCDVTGKTYSNWIDVSEDDLSKEQFTLNDEGETVSYVPKKYERKLKTDSNGNPLFFPTYTFYVATVGQAIIDSIIPAHDVYVDDYFTANQA